MLSWTVYCKSSEQCACNVQPYGRDSTRSSVLGCPVTRPAGLLIAPGAHCASKKRGGVWKMGSNVQRLQKWKWAAILLSF